MTSEDLIPKLQEVFSEDEIHTMLLEAMYARCLAEHPEIIRKIILMGQPSADDVEKANQFIKAERLNIVVNTARNMGFPLMVAEVASSLSFDDMLAKTPPAGEA